MEVVSRQDLFEHSSPEEQAPEMELDLEIQEVEHHVSEPEEEDWGSLQLFGGQSVTVEAIEEPELEEIIQSRPDSYYFSKFSDADKQQFAFAAVSGSTILDFAQAATLEAAEKYKKYAKDINADWKKPTRCRPGKQARQRRKEKNIQAEKDRAAERQAFRASRGRGGHRGGRGRGGFRGHSH